MSFFDSPVFVFLMTLPLYVCGGIILFAVRKGNIPKWLNHWPVPQYAQNYSKLDRIRIQGLEIILLGIIFFLWTISPVSFNYLAGALGTNTYVIGLISCVLLIIGMYTAKWISLHLINRVISNRKRAGKGT